MATPEAGAVATVATAVACRSHQQDFDTFCGMASVMMVLNALDPGVPPLSEEFIVTLIPGDNASSAPPDQVACAIEDQKPPAWNGVTFAVIPAPSLREANDAIVRALYDTQAPVATQVIGDAHWLVVVGVLTDVEPVPGAPYTLLGVFVNNPTPTANPGPMTHSDGDVCGQNPGSGELHEFISAVDWAARFPGTSDGRFVCVPGSGTPPVAAAPPMTPLAAPPAVAAADPVTQAALDEIARLGLNVHGPCAELLQNAVPSVGPPAGGHGLPWYVTLDAGGSPTAIARIDGPAAGPHTFLGVAVTPPGGTMRVASADEMVTKLQGREFDVADLRVAMTEGEYDVIGPCWRPCRESPSPYDPLYEIRFRADSRHGARRYYTTLGAVRLYDDMTWFDGAPTSAPPPPYPMTGGTPSQRGRSSSEPCCAEPRR
jgi:hypothetical protein